MTWQGPSTRKQSDKKMRKAAELAQKWLKKGFSTEQVAKAIWNRIGYATDTKGDVVRFYGHYNDEKKQRIRCEITIDNIVGPY